MEAATTLTEPPAGRDWSELPLDALSLILTKVGAIDVLMGAGLVCRSWLDAAKVPDVWRTVDMENPRFNLRKDKYVLRAMAKVAVGRSDEHLEVFAGKEFVNDNLLKYIVERSPSLRTLRLVSCHDLLFDKVISVILKSPLRELRSLQLDNTDHLSVKDLSVVIENCPRLELLSVRNCFDIVEEDDVNDLVAKYAGSSLTFDWDHSFLHYESDSKIYYEYCFDDWEEVLFLREKYI